ncbi:amidohydrolase [Vibrio sp. Of7-15]|uniref:amidohydrolase n=1 Tax=Vibrio sp. Of7-15 TaxID=2724879 RepID=UPI001EF2B7A7|nr:amidohydrolase [Vibrio sp. Of7-15]MCG7499443.1 amidohydrolase [Vibrio sp. Of7-15]
MKSPMYLDKCSNKFLNSAGFVMLMACSGLANALEADTVLINAKVYTANASQSYSDAIAIKNGKIIALGQADVDKVTGYSSEVIDLEGLQVLPGFIDNHNHVFEAASEAGGNCELEPELLPKEQLKYFKQCLFQNRNSSDEWIIGWGHTISETLSEDAEYSPLEVIDSVIKNKPAIFMEQTSHSMWVNSKALEVAGITVDSKDPAGGIIMKDEDSGELLGILIDNAGDIVMEKAWNSLNNKFEQSYEGLLNGLSEAAQHGVTTIGDGRLYWKRGWYDVWQAVKDDDELTARVSVRPWIYPHVNKSEQLRFLKKIQSSDKNDLLIVDQVKMYSDGIIVNGSAKTLAPYNFTYFPASPYGLNYIPENEMADWLISLDKLGYGAHIHAIGDGGVQDSLNAIENARKSGSKQKYNMTHLEMISASDLPRFKSLDVDADFQLGSDYIAEADHSWAEPLIGKKRAHALMPIRKVYDTGANVTLSSDWNVNSINPLAGIANAVKLRSKGLPNVNAAVNAYTINAARALGLEDVTGSLEVGKSADLVVLDRNIMQGSVNDIRRATVLMTMLQGELVFELE